MYLRGGRPERQRGAAGVIFAPQPHGQTCGRHPLSSSEQHGSGFSTRMPCPGCSSSAGGAPSSHHPVMHASARGLWPGAALRGTSRADSGTPGGNGGDASDIGRDAVQLVLVKTEGGTRCLSPRPRFARHCSRRAAACGSRRPRAPPKLLGFVPQYSAACPMIHACLV